MISYEPLYNYIRKRQITIKAIELGTGRSLYESLNKGVLKTNTIADICFYLKCNVSDVIEWKESTPSKEKEEITIKDGFFKILLSEFKTYKEASLSIGKSINYFQQLSKKRTAKKYIFQKLCSKLNLNAEDYYD